MGVRVQGSKTIAIPFLGEIRSIQVIASFDNFLDQFAQEVGGNLTDERCPFGVLLWPSARILADSLIVKAPFSRAKSLKIVELGCGVGFLSCALALLYPLAEVIAADYEPGLEEYVKTNAAAWGLQDRIRFQQLDWRQALPSHLQAEADWVLGADVFYDDSHIQQLPLCALAMLKSGGILTLADPQRYRFSKALEILQNHFILQEQSELVCAMDQEGIEDFMINRGLAQQMISILQLLRP